ncbi:chemotaxis protein CheX [Bacillus marinisedimentorum]|uniref:chemotaxis protein CheX n=1 Tax=Bacillus marinisedimentorum TaxID=1821260 RepID=UPI0007DF8B78|nr:chemotaxis protein CheX [Bacillus marinisedimentorum]
MQLNENVAKVLNGAIQALKTIVPEGVEIYKPLLIEHSFTHLPMAVLIGMTGDVRGRLLIDGDKTAFGALGEKMFGMPLEGDLLESFTGEFGNMFAGNLSTVISKDNVLMDITPPTIMTGRSRLSGFDKALHVPIKMDNDSDMNVFLMLETSN